MMNTLTWILATISGLILLFALILLSTYNSLIRKRNRVKTDFADIQVQLHRRASLIQNLVDMVREYTKHEGQTFKDVAAARSAVSSSKTAADSAQADNMLTATLRSLMMVTEAYPELLASENFQQLRTDIKETENVIAKYREEYNSTVEQYNNTVQTFPTLLIATMFGFQPEGFFQPTDQEVLKVNKE